MKRMIKPFVPALIPICILLLGMMASCTSDEDSGGYETTGISLHIQAVTRGTDASVQTGSEAENKIDNVHVWFFAENAVDGDLSLYYTRQAASSVNGELVLNFTDEELRLHHDMNSEGKYQLFVAANLPIDATIGAGTTLDELKSYSYSASTRPDSPFCMTGSTNGAHDFAIDSRASIPLLRVASRLDIKVVNVTGKKLQVNKISIADDQQSVQLFAPVSGTAPASEAFMTATDIYTTSITADEVSCSGYIYENLSSTSTKVIVDGSIDGTPATWTAEIKPQSNGSAILPRNTICDIILKLKDALVPTDVKIVILNWNKEPIETSFTNTYIDVDKTEVMVRYLQGGVLGIKSDAKSIHVNWNTAPGFYLAGYEDQTEATVVMSDKHVSLTFYFKGTSDVVVPDGAITITAGNLKKTINLKKEIDNLIFVPRLIMLNGHEIHEGDTIPGDIWGSLKDEERLGITCHANLTWAYKCTGYSEYSGSNVIDFTGYSIFNGTTGDSTPDTELGIIPVFNQTTGFDVLLPVNVTLTFYLNSPNPPYNGVILSTFHFTIDK